MRHSAHRRGVQPNKGIFRMKLLSSSIAVVLILSGCMKDGQEEASDRVSSEEAPDSASSVDSFDDRVLDSGQLQGQLLGFQQGDYIHALVRSDQGKIMNFFVGLQDGCFLALNRDNDLHIEYDNIERYFPEGQGFYPASVITEAKTADSDLSSWLQEFDLQRDLESCEDLIEKYASDEFLEL